MALQIKEAWNLHRNSKSYTGSFPEGFMKNLNKFLGLSEKRILHLFGGIVKANGLNDTNDINENLPTTFHFDARKKFPIKDNTYFCVIADPPYDTQKIHSIYKKNTKEDKSIKIHYGKGLYNCEFVKPYSFIDEAVRVCKPGGYIAVLHFLVYKQPEGAKRYALIPIISGPNLRIRALSIFQKDEA
jgi:hypothetical protein